ncbi:hypothetical protein JCM10908_003646 [Rhodotorula pacifica]|uniref:WD40 repeat domain-containing protein n=1 Tax=Rhodotorula pacifica TaxID=1495444 RepID=UPI0031746F54
MSPRCRLPYIAVQPSLPHVIADILAPGSSIAVEDCWVSCYAPAPPDHRQARDGRNEMLSVHGKIRLAESDEKEGEVECLNRDERVQVEMRSQSEFTVACPELAISETTILFPSPQSNTLLPTPSASSSSYNPTTQELPPASFHRLAARGRRGGIETFALSSDGRRVVVGGMDGMASVVEVVEQVVGGEGGRTARTRLAKGKETPLRGHVGDLTDAAFFPSNEVVLTASSDMILRVFSALDGTSPRTLKSHSKRVTSLHILASPTSTGPHKGRLVLSSSLDGTIRLWDVSTSSNEQTWTLSQPISKMLIVSSDTEEDAEDVLKGKKALAAHTDGTVSIVDLTADSTAAASSSRGGVYAAPVLLRTSSGSPIETISVLAAREGWIATGSRNGVVSLFRLSEGFTAAKGPLELLLEWTRTEGGSSILDVELSKRLRTSGSCAPSRDEDRESFSLLVAPSDGLAYRAVITPPHSPAATANQAEPIPALPHVRVVEEFVGPDCEPTTGITEDERGRVWISAGGTDGGLRVYERD